MYFSLHVLERTKKNIHWIEFPSPVHKHRVGSRFLFLSLSTEYTDDITTKQFMSVY